MVAGEEQGHAQDAAEAVDHENPKAAISRKRKRNLSSK